MWFINILPSIVCFGLILGLSWKYSHEKDDDSNSHLLWGSDSFGLLPFFELNL